MAAKKSKHTERTANIKVLVQDNDLKLLNSAKVNIQSSDDDTFRTLEYDKRTMRYIAADLSPGRYRLLVKAEGLTSDEREVTLEPGDNLVFVSLGPEDLPFYIAGGERAYFRPDEENRLVLYAYGRDAAELVPELLEDANLTPRDEEEQGSDEATFFVNLPSSGDERHKAIETIQERMRKRFPQYGVTGHLAVPIYRGPKDEQTLEGLTDEIIVRFTSEVTEEEAQEIAKRFECEIMRTINYAGNAYLWQYKGPVDDILDVINKLRQQHSRVVYAEPNVVQTIELDAYTPNDYLYPEQPHFGVISAEDAWDLLDDVTVNLRAGSPDICIAVFDPHGVDPTHPELTGNLTTGNPKMVANFNFTAMANQTVAGLGGDHGTQCASSATGRFDSDAGGIGLAGNCRLIGARLPSNASNLAMADAWIWAAGFNTGNTNSNFPTLPAQPADVISNSWGVTNGALTSFVRDALDFLTVYGRGGRGCVVCFSLGNLGYVQFTNLRRYASYERTVAVGASINANPTNPTDSFHADPSGNTTNLPAVIDTRTYYSPFGPEVDLVSPSHTAYDPGLVDPIVAAVQVNTGDWPGDNTSATSLTANVNSGDTSLDVANTTGFTAGEFLALRAPGDANFEVVSINSVSGNTINVGAVQNAHPVGTSVATGANDYERSFGGTSHACPTVAGAAALVISLRPELTWVQVREILRTSADEIDFGQTNTTGQWVDNDGDGVNEFSQWYGYGRLNVEAAIQMTSEDYDPADLADVVIRDNLSDDGDVPSPGWHAHSPDIWVRQTDDPIPSLAYGAAPPHQNARRGQDNYVYLRVRNRGAAPTNEVYLRALISHFPGFEFRYPEEWLPSTRPGDPVPSPLEPGSYLIDEVRIDNLATSTDTIVKMTWPQALVPPETVTVAGMNVHWHPCILADVTPHDGPDPVGSTGYPVRHDNNLAHRNISIDDAPSGDSFAVAVVAGTHVREGVRSIILDRTFLPEGMRVFVRIDDERLIEEWFKYAKYGKIRETEPLPSSKKDDEREVKKGNNLGLRLRKAVNLEVNMGGGEGFLMHLPKHAEIMPLKFGRRTPRSGPKISNDRIDGQQVIVFEGGSRAIEIPTRLHSGSYVPVVIGIDRQGQQDHGELRATQRLGNGVLSPGYTISI